MLSNDTSRPKLNTDDIHKYSIVYLLLYILAYLLRARTVEQRISLCYVTACTYAAEESVMHAVTSRSNRGGVTSGVLCGYVPRP
jgi:hypothetical protein